MIKYLAVLIIIAAVGAGYYYTSGAQETPAGDSLQQTHDAPVIAESRWTFGDAGEKNGIPQTRVSYTVEGKTADLGTFEGHCADMAGSAWTMRDGAFSGAICWFAGGGTEIGVFKEGGAYVIKTAALDEGTAEEGGVRGEMLTKLSL